MKVYLDLINAILTQKTITGVEGVISLDCFNGQGNTRLIYEYIRDYFKKHKEIPEPNIVMAAFKDFEYQERFGKVEEFVKIVQRDIYYRDYVQNLQKMANYSKSIQENTMSIHQVHRQTASLLNDLSLSMKSESAVVDLSRNVEDYMRRYYEKSTNLATGVPTYIDFFDERNILLSPGDLIYMFGRPGCGKTWSMVEMFMNAWKDKRNPLFLSYEMTEHQLDDRMVCLAAGVNYTRLLTGTLNPHELTAIQSVKESWAKANYGPLNVVHSVDVGLDFIEAKIIELNPSVVYLDYLHLIKNPEKNMTKIEAIETKSKGLKQLAGRHKVPIVVITHSNRQFAQEVKEESKKHDLDLLPQIDNMADADGCGKDADMIIGFHSRRPYPSSANFPDEGSLNPKSKIMYVGIVKGRFVEECATRRHLDPANGSIRTLGDPGSDDSLPSSSYRVDCDIPKEQLERDRQLVEGSIDDDSDDDLIVDMKNKEKTPEEPVEEIQEEESDDGEFSLSDLDIDDDINTIEDLPDLS